MKRTATLLFTWLFAALASAQQQLHIHHINIGNGDATLIGIYDVTQEKYTSKILIDGGQLNPDVLLLPYIKKMIGPDPASLHFDYIILTHYHDDHYTGLLALQDGRLTADSIIDPGGYKVSDYFTHTASSGTKPDSLKKAMTWLNALKTAARHQPTPFVKGRSKIILQYGTNASSSIGHSIMIGKVGDNEVKLECIAGWGNTLSKNGTMQRDPKPKSPNANNFTLGFILSCGQFRYFIGGDMGGQTNDTYIDQETTVTKFLVDEYPKAVSISGDSSFKGHVCGFKANHHGSNNSNTAAFMQGMRPAIAITSAGNNNSWHLPNPEYLKRLALVRPLSISSHTTDSTFDRGVYFTNLFNFTAAASKTKANSLFKNKPGISYDFGNNTTTSKGSYLIKITDEEAIKTKSVFEVGRVDIDNAEPYKRLAVFFCHTK